MGPGCGTDKGSIAHRGPSPLLERHGRIPTLPANRCASRAAEPTDRLLGGCCLTLFYFLQLMIWNGHCNKNMYSVYTKDVLTLLIAQAPNATGWTTQIDLHTAQALSPAHEREKPTPYDVGRSSHPECIMSSRRSTVDPRERFHFGSLHDTDLLQADVGRVDGSSRGGSLLSSVGEGKVGSPGNTDSRNKRLFVRQLAGIHIRQASAAWICNLQAGTAQASTGS